MSYTNNARFCDPCIWLICLAFTFLALQSGTAVPSATTAVDSEAFASLGEWIPLQEELREHIDQTFIELEAALEANEYDAGSLAQFVSREIAFQQYAGVVRGAVGTLQTRSGNALDQSLLLATLLKDAGYDAQIAQARISSDQAGMLLSQMTRIPDPPQVFTKGASEVLLGIAEFLEGQDSTSNSDSISWDTELEEHRHLVDDLSSAISTALARKDVSLDRRRIPAEIAEEARSYFWCQYRDGSSSKWINAHPVFATTPSEFAELQPDTVHKNEVPEELLQRIKIQLFASRKVGGKEETSEIMQSWVRPVANLYGTPIVVSLIPRQLSRAAEEDYDPSTDLFLPYLNGSLAPSAKAFDLNGNIVPADAALSNMAGLFKTASDKANSAATALQGLGTSKKSKQGRAMVLEEVWLEISLSGPGVESDQRWRRSFRSDGGSGLPTAHSVARRVVLNLAAGPISPAQSYDRLLKLHLEALKITINQQHLLESDSLRSLSDPGAAEYEVDYATLDGIDEFTSYLDLLDQSTESRISFRPQPLIVARHFALLVGGTEPEGIDIVNSARRSFESEADGQLQFAPAVSLRLGVAEAVSEHAMVERGYGASVSAVSASRGLLRGATPTVFAKSSESGSQSSESLHPGRVVVSPPTESESHESRAWWEIDPATGETIGITGNGWGGSTEDLITRKIVIGATCMMIVQSTCRMYSRTAVAAIAIAISGSGYAGCKFFFMFGPGSSLPPGTPDPCDEMKKGYQYVVRALRGVETWLYEYCYKQALPECVKAAVAGG